MKTLKMTTYFNADDAELVIGFLTEMQDALWQYYGEEILVQHQREAIARKNQQLDLDFDDPVPF